MLLAAGEEPARIGPLYTPAQQITDVTPPTESLLMMAVSEEGYVWQWDMPLQVITPCDPPCDTAIGMDMPHHLVWQSFVPMLRVDGMLLESNRCFPSQREASCSPLRVIMPLPPC